MGQRSLDRLAQIANLRACWEEFRASHRHTLPGGDGVTVKQYAANLPENLQSLRQKLVSGYRFSPLRAVALRKPNSSKYRIICVPTIQDRLAQRAVLRFLISDERDRLRVKTGVSFAFIKGEGGVRRAQEIATQWRTKHPWAYKSDVSSFFDTIDRPLLIGQLERRLRAKSLLPLLIASINCEATPDDEFVYRKMKEAQIEKGRGLRQGMPISPLLANFVLEEFDHAFKTNHFSLVRYADDFVVLADSYDQCRHAHSLAREMLRRIKHAIPDIGVDKTSIASPNESIDFLGLLLSPRPSGGFGLFISDDQRSEIASRLGGLSDLVHLRHRGITFSDLTKKLRDIQIGYESAYENADNFQSFHDWLGARMKSIPEAVLRRIFPANVIENLPAEARQFLGLQLA